MWPFTRKKKPEPEGPSPAEIQRKADISECAARFPVGSCWEYLGRRMVVTRNYKLVAMRRYYSSIAITLDYQFAAVVCDYADEHGVIHHGTIFEREEWNLLRPWGEA